MEIIAQDATSAWKHALRAVLHKGETFTDEHGYACRELLTLTLIITQPETTRDLLLTARANPLAYYPTPEELERAALSPKLGGFHYTIGQRLAMAGQLDYIVNLLKENPYSRRAIAIIWQPGEDAKPRIRNTPGLITLDFKRRANMLHLTAFIRSADIYLGLPASAYQLYIIQQTLARRLDSPLGKLIIHTSSAHIFSHEEDAIRSLLQEKDDTHSTPPI